MSKSINKDKFNFFIPLDFEKATDNSGQTLTRIKGVCSSATEDADGETLYPEGFDFKPLLEAGFLNWNHQASKTSKAICGEPTAAKVINGGKDFYIEGYLYPNEEGKNVAELAETLEKHSSTRRLGFSIEGQALERDALNPKKITRARITGVAITQSPKNPNTLMSIVKGEYNDPYILDEEEEKEDKEKAIDTGAIAPAMPESVEGPEHHKKLVDVAGKLNKSDIYISIYNRYTTNIEKAKQIYDFVLQVNKKIFNNMAVEKITPEVLQKSFDILDAIVKGESSDEPKTPQDYDKKDEVLNKDEEVKKGDGKDDEDEKKDSPEEENDEVKKARACETMAKGLLASGMTKEAVVKAMTSVGVDLKLAETACEACISQASNLDANGGDIEKMPGFQKSLEDSLSKGFEPIAEHLEGISVDISKKFAAIGQILKSVVAENSLLKGQVETLSSNLEKAKEDFEEKIKQPLPRKSATGARVIEKFEKSADGTGSEVFNVNNKQDVAKLSNRLFAEVQLIKSRGQEDATLEKAVMDLEISKSTNYQALLPRLRAMNINLVSE